MEWYRMIVPFFKKFATTIQSLVSLANQENYEFHLDIIYQWHELLLCVLINPAHFEYCIITSISVIIAIHGSREPLLAQNNIKIQNLAERKRGAIKFPIDWNIQIEIWINVIKVTCIWTDSVLGVQNVKKTKIKKLTFFVSIVHFRYDKDFGKNSK